MKNNRIYPDEIEFIRNNMNTMRTTEMAEWIGCSRQVVLYHIHKLGGSPYRSKWHKDVVDTIVTMKNAGIKVSEIIKKTGLDQTQCYNKILNLKKEGRIR